MDLKKLKHLVALAEEGSFAKAAVRLHLTQPALTRSIQSLEQGLGIKLFDRHPGGAWLTSAGQKILAGARELLRSANGLRREAELMSNAQRGSLTLGVGPVPAQSLLSPALIEFMRDRQAIQLHIEVLPCQQLLEKLLAESIEFFISNTYRLSACQDISIDPLGALSLGFYVRPGHPLLDSSQATLQKLYRYPLISHGLSDQLVTDDTGVDLALTEWPGRLSCENILVLKSIVRETDALLMTAKNLVVKELSIGALVPVETCLLDQGENTALGIVTLANRSLSPLAECLIDIVKSQWQANRR